MHQSRYLPLRERVYRLELPAASVEAGQEEEVAPHRWTHQELTLPYCLRSSFSLNTDAIFFLFHIEISIMIIDSSSADSSHCVLLISETTLHILI